MISLNTLIFPNTDIFRDNLYPLLLFCSPLHYLLPIESGVNKCENDESDSFMEQGLCQAHTPVLLGKNRDRFLHLIRDIENRKDDYAAQLSSLTMAAMSAPSSHKRGEQRHEIISSLLSGHSVKNSGTDDDELALWQARLVLAIAEILDREEEELQQHLHILDDRELEMLREIQGENDDEDNPFSQLEKIKSNLLRARPEEMKKRFKAWLHLMKRQPLPDHLLWLATSQDSADQIFNAHEKSSNTMAIPILKILLPSKISISTPHLLKQIKQFHESTQDIHQAITTDLEKLASLKQYDPKDPDTLIPDGTDWVDRWQSCVDDFFPENVHGRTGLTIYILPDTPIPALFSLDKTKPNPDVNHGLLAVFDNF